MAQLFFSYAQTGLWTLLFAVALAALTPVLRRRYRAGILRLAWLALAVRLLVPAGVAGNASVRLEIAVPAALTKTAVKAPQSLAEVSSGASFAALQAGMVEAAGAARFAALSPAQWAAGVWLTGATVLLTVELVRYALWRRRTMRWNRPLPAACGQEIFLAARRLGMTRAPRAFVNSSVRVPMAVGVFRTVLLLPPELIDETRRGKLVPVLLHELTHCRRRDTLCRFAVLLARCLHWYNPGAWLVERQFERAAELACDEAVLNASVSRKAYADALMEAVKASAGHPSLTTCFASDKRFLRSRFAAIFSRDSKRRGVMLAVAVCALSVCTALVACSPAAQQSAPSGASSPQGTSASDSSGDIEALASFDASLEGVYTTRKVYAYTRVENPENGAALDSEAGTYTEIGLPELEGEIGIPLCGGMLDGTQKIRLCTAADNGETVFYTSDDGGATYQEKRSSVTLPDGRVARVIEMQNVTDELCLLLAVDDAQENVWLLRCEADENGLPVTEGAQASVLPVGEYSGGVRMSFVNEDVGIVVDKYGALSDKPFSGFTADVFEDPGYLYAMPCVWRTTDGGETWTKLDFSNVLADCPFNGFYACCIFTVGSRTEIRCFTTPDVFTHEWVALVSDDFGETWDWYPRVPGEGTDFVIEEDKAAGLEKILPMIYPEDDGGEEYARIREFIDTDGWPETLYFRF